MPVEGLLVAPDVLPIVPPVPPVPLGVVPVELEVELPSDWLPVEVEVLLLSDWSPVLVELSIERLERPRRSMLGLKVEVEPVTEFWVSVLDPVIDDCEPVVEPVTEGLVLEVLDDGEPDMPELVLLEAVVSSMQSWWTGLDECSLALPVDLSANFPAFGLLKLLQGGRALVPDAVPLPDAVLLPRVVLLPDVVPLPDKEPLPDALPLPDNEPLPAVPLPDDMPLPDAVPLPDVVPLPVVPEESELELEPELVCAKAGAAASTAAVMTLSVSDCFIGVILLCDRRNQPISDTSDSRAVA